MLLLLAGWTGFARSRIAANDESSFSIDVALLSTISTVATAAVLSLSLSLLGWFSLPSLAACTIGVGIILNLPPGHRRSLLRTAGEPRLRGSDVALAVLLVVSFALYYPPFEEISLHQDGNVYLQAGTLAARTGGFTEKHQLLAGMNDSERRIFFDIADPRNATQLVDGRIMSDTSIAFYGFYISDEEKGLIVPQYLHLLPALFAPVFAMGGVEAALLVPPVIAVGLLAVVARVGSRLFGEWPGVMATGILALMPVQLWFARYPSPEMFTALLMFGGVLAAVLYFERGHGGGLLLLSAALIGATAFVRLDGILFAFPFLAWLLFIALHYQAKRAAMFAAAVYSLVIAAAGAYYAAVPSTYLDSILGIMMGRRVSSAPLSLTAAFLAAVVAAGLFFWGARQRRSPPDRDATISPRARAAVAGVSAILAASFALLAFVNRSEAPISTGWWNIEMLSWYWGWLPLALLPMGIAAGLFYGRSPVGMLLIGLLMAPTLYYLDHLGNQNVHPWGMRRYVDTTLPLVAIGFAGLLSSIGAIRWLPTRGASAAVGLVGVLLIAPAYMPYSMHLANHVEFEGLTDQTAAISANYSGQDILLLHNQFVLPSIGPALRYMHGIDAVLIWQEPATEDELQLYAAAVERWRQAGREVHVVNPSAQFRESLSYETDLVLYPEDSTRLSVPKLKFQWYARAEEIRQAVSSFDVYGIYERDPGAVHLIKMGAEPEGSVRNWHRVEQYKGEDFRWSSDNSTLGFRGPFPDGSANLVLRVNGWRPEAAPAAALTIMVGGEEIHVEVPTSTTELVVPIGNVTGERLDVKLASSTWSPKDHLDSQDSRSIGVRVFAAELVFGNGP